jgi:AcrR family transcriptional regulator
LSSRNRTAAERRPSHLPRRRVPRPEREAQLISIALPKFAARGLHAVSVDEVAAEAGVTKPMVYAYFGSKDGLFEACAEAAARGLEEALAASAAEHLDPEMRMWHGLLTVFRFVDEHAEAWRLLYAPTAPAGPFAGPAARASRAMADLVTQQMVESARARGFVRAATDHLEPLAHAFVHATIGMGSWWLEHRDQPRELQALRMMNLAWMGFGDLDQGRFWIAPPPGRTSKERDTK